MADLEEILQIPKIKEHMESLPEKKKILFLAVLYETAHRNGSRLLQCHEYIQHGSTTVLMHVILVAITALALANRFHIRVSEEELVRGALLHDYFLYDWHERSWPNSIHGFTHPGKAVKKAREDFELTKIEENMIKRHMFPLTVVPPTCREAVLLCIADKICATGETLHRRAR